jgi:preprotein translocase subunit SecA
MQSRPDGELRDLTGLFRARLGRGESLDDLLPEAFAAVREAAARTLGRRHTDAQIIGGAALHRGTIVELRAGEGKTLTVALAAYLNALPGAGVQVLTASDYLAARDAGRLGSLYRFLGLSTGLITAELAQTPELRRPEYAADVTYGGWSEVALDYLRDNLVWGPEELVQRGHPLAIADDAGLILIDAMEWTPAVTGEGHILARVDAWDYLRQYQRLAGIAGRAVTDARTYRQLYHLDVVPVPPDKPVIRVDHPDGEYRTRLARLTALADQTGVRHAAGQPVLIATESAEESGTVSGLLAERGISHEVLTAADDERDAQVLAGAGRRGAVTVITGTAGQGTGSRLGGPDGAGHDEIAGLGGLCVLGTVRPARPRPELELRDRAGGQGDSGEAKFFWSYEDDLVTSVLYPKTASFLSRHGRKPRSAPAAAAPPGRVSQARSPVSELIDNQQAWAAVRQAEHAAYVVSYGSVLADQQHAIYARRRTACDTGLQARIRSMIDEVIGALVTTADEYAASARLWRELRDLYPAGVTPDALAAQAGCTVAALTPEFIVAQVTADAQRAYDRREAELGEPFLRELERRVTLSVIDRAWRTHLEAMSALWKKLGTGAADGVVPLADYQCEGALLAAALDSAIERETIGSLFNLDVAMEEP